MAKYTLGKEEEGKQIIEKSEHTTEFHTSDLVDNVIKLRKMKMELTAQASYNGAEVANLLKHNPWLKDMDDEKLKIGFLYERAMGTKDAAERKLVEVEAVLAEEMKAIADIKEQTGHEVELPVEAPVKKPKEVKKDVK